MQICCHRAELVMMFPERRIDPLSHIDRAAAFMMAKDHVLQFAGIGSDSIAKTDLHIFYFSYISISLPDKSLCRTRSLDGQSTNPALDKIVRFKRTARNI